MKPHTLPSRPAVQASKSDYCPECRHRMDDYSHSHYPDCRYFWIETERDEDIDSHIMMMKGGVREYV